MNKDQSKYPFIYYSVLHKKITLSLSQSKLRIA